eukprot:3665908-Alexandrium_andersonii.AAC.1
MGTPSACCFLPASWWSAANHGLEQSHPRQTRLAKVGQLAAHPARGGGGPSSLNGPYGPLCGSG